VAQRVGPSLGDLTDTSPGVGTKPGHPPLGGGGLRLFITLPMSVGGLQQRLGLLVGEPLRSGHPAFAELDRDASRRVVGQAVIADGPPEEGLEGG